MCSLLTTESFIDRRKVEVGLEPEMDVYALYVHYIAVLAILWRWVDVRW